MKPTNQSIRRMTLPHERTRHRDHVESLARFLVEPRPMMPEIDGNFPGESTWTDAWTDAAIDLGLAGLVLEAAKRHEIALPVETEQRLTMESSAVLAANLNAEHELARLLGHLSRRDIRVMLLKGAALHATLYFDPSLRPMTDVDVLVRMADVPRALNALTELGYHRGADLVRDDFFPTYHYEMEWTSASPRPVRFDFHARPLRPLRFAPLIREGDFWEAAQSVSVGKSSAFVPRAETMLIHLLAHAAFHGCSRLIWMYDIHRLVSRDSERLDWDLLAKRVARWRLTHPASEAISIVHALFGETFPAEFLRAIAKQPVSWRDRWTLRQAPHDAERPVLHVLTNLLCTPGWSYRLGYLRAVLAPSAAHLSASYRYRHRGWSIVACALRPIRALWRMIAAPVRRLAAGS